MAKDKNPRQRNFPGKKPDRIASFKVEQESQLLTFLIASLNDKSRTTIKSYLAHNQIAVDGRAERQFDRPLNPGDTVSVNFDNSFYEFRNPQLRIVYEDNDIIVIDKASGLLSMATDQIKDKTAYRIISDYLKRKDIKSRLFILHRLDRDTSGLMMFAKSLEVQAKMQANWDNMILRRNYIAVVEGRLENPEGEIKSFLAENSAMNVYSTTPELGKLAITRYRTIQTAGKYSLLEFDLLTGRKNQIRVHMKDNGTPIAGDKKYGAKSNPSGRMLLHANRLNFVHPTTGEKLLFETGVPTKFKAVFR
ncbi:MAG: RluA family pseudouridine synthase [Bacteroidales bacterium]|nr:RluA family pseudouridine synthase [Bacteroidales bacterium]